MSNETTRAPLAVVTGCTRGLGLAITTCLLASGWRVEGWSRDEQFKLPPAIEFARRRFTYRQADLKFIDEIADCVVDMAGDNGDEECTVDALINCAGINYLKPFEQFEFAQWEDVMDTNAKALAMTTRCLLPYLANPADPLSGGTVLNIISNAAGMPMTHSLAYNASKAAALMVSRQLAREIFKSHGVTVFSISPNKLSGTGMSLEIEAAVPALRGWTPEEAAAYQKAALPTGMETPPGAVAEFITFLLSKKERHIFLHGCDIPYGG